MSDQNPYTPPRAKVTDVGANATTFRLRLKWVYLGALLVMVWFSFIASDLLWDGLTFWSLAPALVLTGLLAINPIRGLMRRRDGALPVWWDVMFYSTVGLFIYGGIGDDPMLLLIGYVPMAALSALLCLGYFVVEARHSVRIYGGARMVYFVADR